MNSVRSYNKRSRLLLSLIGLGLSLSSAGCGKQAFFVSLSQEQQKAPGAFIVAPKVDIMLVQDDTGSMIAPYQQVAAQIPPFLSNLQAKGWNYHFATSTLT